MGTIRNKYPNLKGFYIIFCLIGLNKILLFNIIMGTYILKHEYIPLFSLFAKEKSK